MTELVTDCPRCNAKHTTFTVLSQVLDKNTFFSDLFCKCRHCFRSVVFNAKIHSQSAIDHINSQRDSNITQLLSNITVVTIQPGWQYPSPDHLPEEIKENFDEGAKCYSIGCYNAAATMFRLCLDKATKSFLPDDPTAPPAAKIRRSLGFRMDWLFENNILPSVLKGLAECIKDDGNDGAHEGILSKVDVDDLIDFTITLLERLYTEPKKLELANQRRLERRQQ